MHKDYKCRDFLNKTDPTDSSNKCTVELPDRLRDAHILSWGKGSVVLMTLLCWFTSAMVQQTLIYNSKCITVNFLT